MDSELDRQSSDQASYDRESPPLEVNQLFGKNNKLDTTWLGQVSFFDQFTPEQLEEVSSLGQKVTAGPGALLTDQGNFGEVSYIVIDGTANVLMNGEYVASVGPGSVVGEMSLLEHRPRVASVVAETEMVLVSFGIEEFRSLLDRNPTAKDRILTLLDARSRANLSRHNDESA